MMGVLSVLIVLGICIIGGFGILLAIWFICGLPSYKQYQELGEAWEEFSQAVLAAIGEAGFYRFLDWLERVLKIEEK